MANYPFDTLLTAQRRALSSFCSLLRDIESSTTQTVPYATPMHVFRDLSLQFYSIAVWEVDTNEVLRWCDCQRH